MKSIAILKKKPICLTGMMGVGKTYLGQKLADVLNFPFFDTDAMIEEALGLSVADIFAILGEARFRAEEARIIAACIKNHNADRGAVIATGGGAVLSADTRAVMGAHGISVWLKLEAEALVMRLEADTSRPLLHGTNVVALKDRVETLLEQRQVYYAQADIHFDVPVRQEDAADAVEAMILALKQFCSSSA